MESSQAVDAPSEGPPAPIPSRQKSISTREGVYETANPTFSSVFSPEVLLLHRKFILIMGEKRCPPGVYWVFNLAFPRVLEKTWSYDMSGPHKHVSMSSLLVDRARRTIPSADIAVGYSI